MKKQPSRFRSNWLWATTNLTWMPLTYRLKQDAVGAKRRIKQAIKKRIKLFIDNRQYSWNQLVAVFTQAQLLWTYSIDSEELQDCEEPSFAAVQQQAQNDFDLRFEDGNHAHGDTEDATVEYVMFFYDDATGERRIVRRVHGDVQWECYHGDHAEHFRQSDYI